MACHSTPESKPFAGGLAMATPLGLIHTTNITPDKDTGIGAYTLADFDRAMRHGVALDGHRLYPAMPYPSYAKLADEDIKVLPSKRGRPVFRGYPRVAIVNAQLTIPRRRLPQSGSP